MKKNALKKDFFMEIKKSMGRFLSIFLIVALGVAIFVGIRATQPDMILSGDTYADKNRLMDIKIVSTFGLTESDADVIERLPGIDRVEGTYSTDVLCEEGDNMKVLHVMAQTENMNTITVTEGRLPEKTNECLIDQDFLNASEYEIGDVIQFESGTDDELTDTLENKFYRIVGAGNSPLYFSFDRGSSTIGNGTVSGFAIVMPETFALDVYTEIYATVDGAEDKLAFTEEYESLVEDTIQQIELVQNARCEVRRDDLAEMAQLEIDKARKELNEKREEAESEIEKNENLLDASELELNLGKIQVESGKASIETAKAMLESGKAQIESGKKELEAAKAELESGKQELATSKETYAAAMSALEVQKADLENQIAEWESKLGGIEADKIPYVNELLNGLKEALAGVETQITDMSATIESEFAAGEQQIMEAEAQIAAGEAELLAKEQELLAQEKELLAKEKELNSAESDIKQGEQEIESGKTELENAKQEMEEQIQEGEDEISKAEEEIADMELPVWYIFDRTSIPEYKGYGDNAARIDALAVVFPSIFYLVAALISLTTMTRMVEEQRVQIGTLKALGYSKFAIMKKYLNYALYATLGGSVLGVLLGEKLFPYVIIFAYHNTVYTNIPDILLPYQWGIAIAATLLSILCTGVATFSSCYKELMAQPAILMRPEAPKIGKKTVIEKIPFLWKHLNFSWKSSLRNLFRYKKRFFMTLFGIGGCMGLLMVGYGLRDSISSISDYQYGEIQLYDSSIFIDSDMKNIEKRKLEKYFEDNSDISNYMNAAMFSIKTQNDKEEVDAYLTVIEDMEKIDDFFVFKDRKTDERYHLTNDGIILSEKTAQMLNVKVGDEIFLTEEGKSEHRVEISAICENYVSHYVYMTEELYEELYDKELECNNILIKTSEDLSMTELEKIGAHILTFEDILNVQYTENMSQSIDDMLVALDRVMIVLIVVAGLLSFIVLYNLNNINITERRRELATLKVLGFFDTEVAIYVYRENILLTFFGILVGCVMGKFLHYFTITTVEVDMAMFGRTIFLNSYIICALFTILFSIIVNWIMYFKLKKINMVESLKSVE